MDNPVAPPVPDQAMAQRHVELIGGHSDTPMFFRLIRKADGKADKLSGPLDQVWPQIVEAQAAGYCVFVVVNEGGDTDQAISRIRALFVDADNVALPAAFHVEPDFLAMRDATHWHAYWIVRGAAVEDFTAAQKRLAAHYGADPSICNPSRVMRLAGTLHLKDPAQPRLVQLVEEVGEIGLLGRTADILLAGLPELSVAKAKPITEAPAFTEDSAANVCRAGAWLDAQPKLVEGEGSDEGAFVFAAKLRELGISEAKAGELIQAHQPDFDEAWIADKVQNAYRYAQNAPGIHAAKPAAETFDLPEPPADARAAPEQPRFQLRDEGTQAAAPDIVPLIEAFLPDGGTACIHGPLGSYKSFVAVEIAFAVASGKPAFGKLRVHRSGPVVYLAGEGATGIEKRRWPALRHAYGARGALPFYTVREVPLTRGGCLRRTRASRPSRPSSATGCALAWSSSTPKQPRWLASMRTRQVTLGCIWKAWITSPNT